MNTITEFFVVENIFFDYDDAEIKPLIFFLEEDLAKDLVKKLTSFQRRILNLERTVFDQARKEFAIKYDALLSGYEIYPDLKQNYIDDSEDVYRYNYYQDHLKNEEDLPLIIFERLKEDPESLGRGEWSYKKVENFLETPDSEKLVFLKQKREKDEIKALVDQYIELLMKQNNIFSSLKRIIEE